MPMVSSSDSPRRMVMPTSAEHWATSRRDGRAGPIPRCTGPA